MLQQQSIGRGLLVCLLILSLIYVLNLVHKQQFHPHLHFEKLFTRSEVRDGRASRVFEQLGKEEMTVMKDIALSSEDVQLFTWWKPAKLTPATEFTICKVLKDEQLKEMTDTCRTGAQRRFKSGGYCADPSRHAWIIQIRNAIVCENNLDRDIYWATFTQSGVVVQSQLERGLLPLVPPFTRVRYYEKLANPGYSVHVNSPGHFPVEILPRLVRLYNEIPRDVPLVWPVGPLPLLMLRVMTELNVLDGRRELVKEVPDSIMHVKELWLYHADDDFFPHLLISEFSYMHRLIMKGLGDRFGKSNMKNIVVIDRVKGPRSVINHKEIVRTLQLNLQDYNVMDFVIDSEKLEHFVDEVARVFYEADVIISPHGASLANIIFARPGTSVIEFSWGENPSYPIDYMCFSRNLKMHYSTVIGQGSHGSQLLMNANEVLDAVKIHLKDIQEVENY